jgi:hypothetical protein
MKITVFALLTCLLLGCTRKLPTIPQVSGTYVYRLSTGEIDALTLNPDLTFQRSLYDDVAQFAQQAAPKFQEHGPWFLSQGNIAISFSSFFAANSPHKENRLASPRITTYSSLLWVDSTATNDRAAIVINESSSYLMYRVKDASEIKTIAW